MGKSYVENSLKRFLKRKVKITLGFVVAFMITGVCAFAVEDNGKDVKEDLKNQNEIYKIVEDNLSGLGAKIFADKPEVETDNGHSIDVTDSKGNKNSIKITRKDGITTIDASAIRGHAKYSFKDNLLSTKVKNNIESALNLGKYTQYYHTQIDERKYAVNNEIVIQEQNNLSAQIAGIKENGDRIDTITNNGILFNPQETALDEGNLINNGIIFAHERSIAGQLSGFQMVNGVQIGYENTKLYNNGLIVSGYSGQDTFKGVGIKFFNNGVISSEKYGQLARESCKDIEMYNYGIIETKDNGQYIISKNTTNSVLKNYGTIITSGIGQEIGENNTNKAYNYGLIKVTNGLAMNGTGEKYNYGVIKSSGTSEIFNGITESNGMVISKNVDDLLSNDWAKDTAIFSWKDDNSYTLKNGIELKDKVTNESFGENKIGAIVNGTADIEGVIKDKNISSIVSGDTGKTTVFTSKGNELVLENTNITGYFENKEGGTVLDVTNSDLTLSGKVNITAVKDQQTTTGNVVAVELGAGKTLTLVGNDVKINGKVNGLDSSTVKAYNFQSEIDVNGNLEFSNITDPELKGYLKENNFTQATIDSNSEINNLTFDFSNTAEEKENTILIENGAVIKEGGSFVDKTTSGNDVTVTIENLETFAQNLEGITFGAGNNTVVVTNTEKVYDKTVDLGAGEDKFTVNGTGKSVFNYHVKNAETVELNGGTWGDWTNADGTIGFDKNTKGENSLKLTLGKEKTRINITLGTEEKGSDFAQYIADLEKELGTNHVIIHGTDKNVSSAKYLIGNEGINFDNLSSDKYSFDKNVNTDVSAIFKVENNEGTETTVTVKTAEEMGLSGQERIIYEAYLDQIKADGSVNTDVIDQINGYESSKDFADLIKETHVTGEAYYTAGSVVTMDIADTYLSAVEDFTKRAKKGEWLAQGKYINSDTEFDGGSEVKGYDGDVTGTVGMIEYGFTENTSYGAVYGQGDSEMDIQGGGKLDGDNTYFGAFMKHRTQNGIELVANIGYVENDMDSVLRNDFDFNNEGNGNKVSSENNKTFEKGTADSSAVILSLKGRKDYKITDTIKLQPVLGARATFINQEKAENPEMHFTIKEQDIIVVEGTAGMGIAKEFAMNSGKLELNTGVEYTFAATNSNNDAEYTLFEGEDYKGTHIKMEDVDAAENTGTFYVGADYEHESGVGFNGKYEMMWSDKGDDSRITAGVSYRF